MKREIWIHFCGKWIKNPNKLIILLWKINNWIRKWELVDNTKFDIIPYSDTDKWFHITNKEYLAAKKIYEEKGSIEYQFYPCAGIGWGVRVKVINTGEIVDITDTTSW